MAADPENDADGDEDQEDHRRDQQRSLVDSPHTRGKRRFDPLGIGAAIFGLVRVGLHRADFVDRLVDVSAGIGDAVLARARKPAHAASEQNDRQQHDRQSGEHQQRELDAGQHQQDQRTHAEDDIAQGEREARADDALQHRRVVGEPGNHFPRARDFEEARRERQQVIEHLPAKIRGDPLADPRHVIEAHVRCDCHYGDGAIDAPGR